MVGMDRCLLLHPLVARRLTGNKFVRIPTNLDFVQQKIFNSRYLPHVLVITAHRFSLNATSKLLILCSIKIV